MFTGSWNKCCLLFIILFCIGACKKDNPEVTYYTGTEYRYIIDLEDGIITKYSKYINDTLSEVHTFDDRDTIIVQIRKNANDVVTMKSIYQIGTNGYAISSHDTVYQSPGMWIYYNEYDYEDGFWVLKTQHWKRTGNVLDSGIVQYARSIENGNVIIRSVSEGGCISRFEYYSFDNKLDLHYFSNGITGKKSKNLRACASWNGNCPSGPSMTQPYSNYEYTLGPDGYVTRMIEVRTPAYHLPLNGEITRTVNRTTFEYY
jgi:hypothetical protein